MKILLILLMNICLSYSAFADGVICYADHTDRDGGFHELKLIAKGKGYSLIQKVKGSRLQFEETKLLAEGLKCNIDEFLAIAYCFKSSKELDEKINSIVKFQLVETTAIGNFTQEGAIKSKIETVVVVGSPLIKRTEFKFNMSSSMCMKINEY